MPKFSDRIGSTQLPEFLEIGSMRPELRTSIWNFYLKSFQRVQNADRRRVVYHTFAEAVAIRVCNFPLDEIGNGAKWLKEQHMSVAWFDVYNILEVFYSEIAVLCGFRAGLENAVNEVLKSESSGYRFTIGVLAPITDEVELESLKRAQQDSARMGLKGVHTHLESALKHISDKKSPDYRNSIKESISAVESAAKLISGTSSGGLKDALNTLDEKLSMHRAFREGLLNLYGYTSNQGGIRHAILDEEDVQFEDAKYMLVACSAFVNFLIAKAEKAGLLNRHE